MKTAEKPKSPSKTLDVHHAVQVAIDYCRRLFPTTLPSLEEVELSEDERYWLITLGFNPVGGGEKVSALFGKPAQKLKVFKVDATTGQVVAMKMR